MDLWADMCGFVSKAFQPSERNGAMASMLSRCVINTPHWKGCFWGGCVSKSFDMRAGVSSRVSTCRRLPKVLSCNVCAVITKGQTPLKRVRLGVCLQEFSHAVRAGNVVCGVLYAVFEGRFYMPGLRGVSQFFGEREFGAVYFIG